MEVTELISTIQTHLDNSMTPEVLVSGSDERPIPGVLIEDWSVNQLEASTTRFITSLYDDQGNETARVYRVPYECRVSFMVREEGEVAGSELHDKLRKELFKLESRPFQLSNVVSSVKLNGGGGIDHQFVNPTESEFQQSATFTTSLVYEDSNFDSIETINTTIEITD